MNDRVTFREGIALQPKALQNGFQALSKQLAVLDPEPIRRGTVALVGIGASLYAAITGAAHMRRHGVRAFALPATDLYDPSIDAAEAYIALSASGRSVEPLHAMELRPHAKTFGIAKKLEPPLARAVQTMISTESGPDSSPNTTSYTGSLLSLALITEKAGRMPSGVAWDRMPELAAEVLDRTSSAVKRAASRLVGCISVDCVGEGAAFGTAGYASLLMREAVRVPAQHWDTLNFLHGPMEANNAHTGVLLFGSGRELKLARDLSAFGISTVLITDRTDVIETDRLAVIHLPGFSPDLAGAILQTVTVQLLIADMMEAVDLPVCEFRYRQTDTKVEAL